MDDSKISQPPLHRFTLPFVNQKNPPQFGLTTGMPRKPRETHREFFSVVDSSSASGQENLPFSKLSLTGRIHLRKSRSVPFLILDTQWSWSIYLDLRPKPNPNQGK